jgi:cytochrome c-type biogenesis protein CcmF
MLFVDLDVERDGRRIGTISPARFIYDASPGQPSTEVGKLVRLREDLYIIAGMLSEDGTAGIQIHVNPLVSLVWLGIALATLGGVVAAWPEGKRRRRSAFGYVQALPSTSGGTP